MFQASITGPLGEVKVAKHETFGFAVLVIDQGTGATINVHVKSVEDAQKLVEAAVEIRSFLRDLRNEATLVALGQAT